MHARTAQRLLRTILLASPLQAPVQTLQADPELQGIPWAQRQDPSYLPFVLLVAGDQETPESFSEELGEAYGPPLAALAESWRSDWAGPLQLRLSESQPQVLIAILAGYETYRKIASKQAPAGGKIPPFLVRPKGFLLTYHRGAEFESKLARRNAILEGAADRLILAHGPSAAAKNMSAWAVLGLGVYLSEIREKPGGRKGTVFVREEALDWRQNLPRLADALKASRLPIPSFEELLRFRVKQADSAPALREYLRFCGYSLILYFKSKEGARFQQPFLAWLKEEFQGGGGFEKLQAKLKTDLPAIEREWEAFCELKLEVPKPSPPPPPAAAKPGSGPSPSPPAPPPSAKAELPPPVPLDLSPESLLELRAEVVRCLRSRRLDGAERLLEDPKLAVGPLRSSVAAEKVRLQGPARMYRAFAASLKPGDSLPNGFGLLGQIVKCDEREFELREKYYTNLHRWAELDPKAVAIHVFYTLKRNGPADARDAAATFLLCGEGAKAKKFLQQAIEAGEEKEEAEAMLKLIPEYEEAGREAVSREEIEKVSKAEPAAVLEAIQKLASQDEIRKTASFGRARPYLEGAAARALLKRFELKGIPSLFQGETKVDPDGVVTIRYEFKNLKESEDWSFGGHPFMWSLWAEGKKEEVTADWKFGNGALRVRPSGGLFHNSWWAGDFSIEWSYEVLPVEGISDTTFVSLNGGILDDGKGNFAANAGILDMMRFTASGPRFAKGIQRHKMAYELEYRMKLSRFGDRLQLVKDGEEIASLEEKGLKAGRAFFYAFGPLPFAVRKVILRGRLDPEWIQERSALWIRKELKSVLGGSPN